MCITYWITKAADTYSECVILTSIAFPRHNGYANVPHFPFFVGFRKEMKKEKTLFSR